VSKNGAIVPANRRQRGQQKAPFPGPLLVELAGRYYNRVPTLRELAGLAA